MANLPSQYPTLSIHLADLSLTPLITSSSPSHLDALASLTSGVLAAQSAAQRAHLGRPQRVMIEYSDARPVVLQAYLDTRDVPLTSTAQPSSAQETPVPDHGGPAATVVAAAVDDNGDIYGDDGDDDDGEEAEENDYDEDNGDDEDPSAPRPGEAAPMLVGLVVASSPEDAREARRAASRLENIGRDFQREWVLQGGSQTRDGTCARMTLH